MSEQTEQTPSASATKGPKAGQTAVPPSTPENGASKPRRRFAPQLEETTVKVHRKQPAQSDQPVNQPEQQTKPRRRFAPQLEETFTRSNKAQKQSSTSPPPSKQEPTIKPRSRFAPQLIETAQRSRRRDDPESTARHRHGTDVSPGDIEHHSRSRGGRTAGGLHSDRSGDAVVDDTHESRFSYANLSRSRRSSVRKPTLERIASSGSEDEKLPSLSHSPSAGSDGTDLHKHATRIRESCDERFTGYLLAHAARIAEQQLKEQALAAYPNEKLHEPVDHFAVDRDSEDSGSDGGYGMLSRVHTSANLARRDSDIGWEASEVQRHREELERQRQARNEPLRQQKVHETGELGVVHQAGEVKQMRNAARPPLLGGDIIFPPCPSPKQTRIDAYQKPRSRRYRDETTSRQQSGLWTPYNPTPAITRKPTGVGLWGGFCDVTHHDPRAVPGRLLQSGLMTPAPPTPANEPADPFSIVTAGGAAPPLLSPFMQTLTHQLPSTPPASAGGLPGIDDKLMREAMLDSEFPDAFVTQVYNYLSLGYPALACKFDFELAKISRMTIEDIRRDDGLCDARGFVDAPESPAATSVEIAREACGRWRALKLYVREWGRQEGRMDDHSMKPGTQVVRRGSWFS